jgi:RHS repeat-associated protein
MAGVTAAAPLNSAHPLRWSMLGLTLAMLFLGWGEDTYAERTQPRVRLTDPERGERRFTAPATIPIEARVEAADGRTIVKVEFFADDQPIAQATAAPYEYVWTDVPAGQYRLQARATDDQGASDWSPPVVVRVQENREPRVRLILPHPHERFATSATVELEARARDRDANLARVEFYADGILLGVSDTAPYRLSWRPAAAGRYALSAKAVDALGANDTSRPVPIEVLGNAAPSASLTSPANGATYTGPADITLTAEAADSDGTIASVEFFQSGTLLATVTSAPYTFTLNNVVAGGYSFSAKATDNAGASTTSAAVSVTVNAGVAQVYFIHTDHLNTPRVITNQAAQVVWRWDQTDPFGGNPPDENPSGLGIFTCNLRLPGQYFDKETNTHYNYFRDYNPAIGRYVQSDPIGLRGGINTYLYVGGDPLLGTDLLGLAKICCRLLDSWIFGKVAGYRHCYVAADEGTVYGLYPETVRGRETGVPRTNDPRDVGGDCFDCPSPECVDQNRCLRNTHQSYPRGYYNARKGPNSNTYAGTLARQCCKGGVPGGVSDAPGIDGTPPTPR